MSKNDMLTSFRPPHALSGLAPDTAILVALSGGVDSVALLAMLRDYAAGHGTPLRIAHVNHGIRGEEAIRDRDFCVDLAGRWEIPISVLDADVPAIREASGGSMEEVARRVRYEFFEQVMAEYHIPLLATAHHADDQLETMLLRLTRGTGPDGLCGIPPIRPLGTDRWVIRPLLSCERTEIERFCRERALDYVIDSTNEDISYARNRIRRRVIPELRAINPAVTQAAARLSEALRADAETLSRGDIEILADWVHRVTDGEGHSEICIPCETLCKLEEAYRRRVLIRMMAEAGCPHAEDRFVRRLAEMARQGREGMRIDLPGGVSARRERGMLYLGAMRRTQTAHISEETALDISHLPRIVDFGDFRVTCTAEPQGKVRIGEKNGIFSEIVYKMSINVALNSATIKRNLFLRTRRAGDRFLWRGHHRKVKKLFCDLGVPVTLRDRLPLLCDSEGILWIPGIGVRDGSESAEGAPPLWVCAQYLSPEHHSADAADRNIRNQQKEETDEE